MILSRNAAFLILFLMVIVPFLAGKTIWILNAKKTTGVMAFIGHDDWGAASGMRTYAVIDFNVDHKKWSLHSSISLDLKKGDMIPVFYQINDPADAVVDDFINLWSRTISYAIFPILILIVMFIMPDRMDPILPRKSKVVIGKRPFIKVERAESSY